MSSRLSKLAAPKTVNKKVIARKESTVSNDTLSQSITGQSKLINRRNTLNHANPRGTTANKANLNQTLKQPESKLKMSMTSQRSVDSERINRLA